MQKPKKLYKKSKIINTRQSKIINTRQYKER